MNRIIKITAIFTVAITAMAFSGCTPGKAQARKGLSSSVFGDKSDRGSGYDEEISFSGNDYQRDDLNKTARSGRPGDESISGNSADIYKEPVKVRVNREPDEKYFQKGYASWYGREFHGKVTASGEKFDMYKYTVAHKKLPFGTVINIRNMSNGKTITARVNDRGPYRGERIVDLSYAAARELGMVEPGMALVGISIVREGNNASRDYIRNRASDSIKPVSGDLDNDNSSGIVSENYYSIQTGAFYSRRNAERLRQRISSIVDARVVVVRDGDLYKVRIKGISSRRDAANFRRVLADEDIPSYMINNRE